MTDQPREILVTGASKGIGRAIALRLARDGFRILVHYLTDEKGAAETLAGVRAQGSDGEALSFDIGNREQCRATLGTLSQGHRLYGVVLNAGIIRDNVFPSMNDAQWDDVIDTNLDGFFNVLRPLVMPLISARTGGRIVVLTSVAGQIGNFGQVNYSAAKAGLIGAAKALALEVAKRGITVNCVAPGLIETQMLAGLPLDELTKMIPVRRIGKPEDVAAAVAFLCSDEAGYITRQVIAVNGGMA